MKSCAAGFTEWLLFHTWQKNNSSPSPLLLPDTILYRLGKPFFWYSTSPTGELLRKPQTHLNQKKILEAFHLTTEEILGSYLSFPVTSTKSCTATLEFFTNSSFQDFLQNPEKCKSGILQKWVQSKSGNNSVIKVQWSNQFCLIEKRTNKFKIDDAKVGFYEKLVTYEGMEHNSVAEPVNAEWIISELQRTCVNIASHVAAVTGGNVTITRMVLYFKHDANDKLWFLYCSALKVMDLVQVDSDKPLEFEELRVSVPKEMLREKLPLSTKAAEVKKNKKLCVGCNYLVRDSMMYEIALHLVVKFFVVSCNLPEQGESLREKKVESEGVENKSDKVPKVIKRLNKGITNLKYQQMVKDPAWEHMQIKVCQECFLHFSQVYSNPEFFKEKQEKNELPVLSYTESFKIDAEEGKKVNRVSYSRALQGKDKIEGEKNEHKAEKKTGKVKVEPVVENGFDKVFEKSLENKVKVRVEDKGEDKSHCLENKTGDLRKNRKNLFVRTSETEETEKKIVESASEKTLPPIKVANRELGNRIKSSKNIDWFGKNIQNQSGVQDRLVKSYMNKIGVKYGKIGYSSKGTPNASTNHSRTGLQTMNNSEFIQDTLSLLKSTISNLPGNINQRLGDKLIGS